LPIHVHTQSGAWPLERYGSHFQLALIEDFHLDFSLLLLPHHQGVLTEQHEP
jgi:hypothetical protein